MKKIFTFLFLSLFFNNILFANEYELFGVKLFDEIKKYAQIKNGKKSEKYSNYKFSDKYVNLKRNSYFKGYYLKTDYNYNIINISGYRIDQNLVSDPGDFNNQCKKEKISIQKKYSLLFNIKNNKFVDRYWLNEFDNSLWHESVIFIGPKMHALSIYCRYKKGKNVKALVSLIGISLMSQDYFKSIQGRWKKIEKLNVNTIKSYLFSSSY